MSETHEYPGGELDLFAEARNWKAYFADRLRPFIVGDVLEVGAGIGATTVALRGAGATSWTSLEPDARLAARLSRRLAEVDLGENVDVVVGTTSSLGSEARFDTALYVDVLEHIEDDAGELARAGALLRPQGRIVVLAPAHQWLYTSFDAAVGHHRRYGRRSLRRAGPGGFELEALFFLDSAGLLASAANRVLLRQSMPRLDQIRLWDRRLVPLSRLIDPLLLGRVGKSIVGVWRKKAA